MTIAIVEGYDFSLDLGSKTLYLSKLTKKQIDEVMANTQAKMVLEQALLEQDMNKIGCHSIAKELEWVIAMHERS